MGQEIDLPEVTTYRLALVGRLVSFMVHEVNNSLASLLGRLQVLVMRADRGPVTVGPELNQMEEDGRRVGDRIRSLFTLAHQAKADDPVGPCIVSDAIREVELILGCHFEKKGITIRLDLPPTLPPVLTRGIDLKLLVSGLAIAFAGATEGKGELVISGAEDISEIVLTVSLAGSCGEIAVPVELLGLSRTIAGEGVRVHFPGCEKSTARLVVPKAVRRP